MVKYLHINHIAYFIDEIEKKISIINSKARDRFMSQRINCFWSCTEILVRSKTELFKGIHNKSPKQQKTKVKERVCYDYIIRYPLLSAIYNRSSCALKPIFSSEKLSSQKNKFLWVTQQLQRSIGNFNNYFSIFHLIGSSNKSHCLPNFFNLLFQTETKLIDCLFLFLRWHHAERIWKEKDKAAISLCA